MTVGELAGRFPDPDTWSQAQPPIDGATAVCVGTNIPIELIRANGLRPVFLVGATMEATPRADEFLEDRYGPEFRSVLEQLLGGVAGNAALIVFDRRFRDLFYYLKEMVRLGLCPDLPALHMFDLILSRSFDQSEFNSEQMRLLGAALTRAAGALPRPPIDEVIGEENVWRAEVRRLVAHRGDDRIDGTTAFRALGAARVLSRAAHRDLLADLNAHLAGVPAAADPDRPRRPRAVLLPGEPLFHDRLHRAVEQAGAVVVAEDSEWGSRLAGRDVPRDGGAAGLLQRCWADASGPEVRPFEARAAWLIEALDEYRPDLVVLWVPPADVRFGWDYPRLVEHVRAAGAAPVLLRSDVLSATGLDEAVATVRAALVAPHAVDAAREGMAG